MDASARREPDVPMDDARDSLIPKRPAQDVGQNALALVAATTGELDSPKRVKRGDAQELVMQDSGLVSLIKASLGQVVGQLDQLTTRASATEAGPEVMKREFQGQVERPDDIDARWTSRFDSLQASVVELQKHFAVSSTAVDRPSGGRGSSRAAS